MEQWSTPTLNEEAEKENEEEGMVREVKLWELGRSGWATMMEGS